MLMDADPRAEVGFGTAVPPSFLSSILRSLALTTKDPAGLLRVHVLAARESSRVTPGHLPRACSRLFSFPPPLHPRPFQHRPIKNLIYLFYPVAILISLLFYSLPLVHSLLNFYRPPPLLSPPPSFPFVH